MKVQIQMKISLTHLILKNHEEESSRNLNNIDKSSFSNLHLNITGLQKKFNSLLLMLLKFEFKAICVTETWCSDNLLKLPQYKSIHTSGEPVKLVV